MLCKQLIAPYTPPLYCPYIPLTTTYPYTPLSSCPTSACISLHNLLACLIIAVPSFGVHPDLGVCSATEALSLLNMLMQQLKSIMTYLLRAKRVSGHIKQQSGTRSLPLIYVHHAWTLFVEVALRSRYM